MNYRKIFFIFSFLIILQTNQHAIAQLDESHDLLETNVKSFVYSDPDQAIIFCKLMLSKTEISQAEKNKIKILLAQAYKVKGNYEMTLKILFTELGHKQSLLPQEKLTIELEKIDVLRELLFKKEAKSRLSNLENNGIENADTSLEAYKKAAIVLEKAEFLLLNNQYDAGIQLLHPAVQSLNPEFIELISNYEITLGKLYYEKRELHTAETFYQKSLKDSKIRDNKHLQTLSLFGLAKVNFQKKNHAQAIKYLKEARDHESNLKNIYLQEMIYQQLNVNYLALKDSLNYKSTNQNLLQVKSTIENTEQITLNTAYNVISEELDFAFSQKEAEKNLFIYISLGVFSSILLGFGLMYYILVMRKKNRKEIIYYLNITRKNSIAKPVEKVQEIKKSTVPKETEDMLMQKLSKFENTKKYTNKDVSLALLASQFETNTKYLSEVISSNYHVNFNTYINKLRINYIIEKLKTDPNFINYKISYLAENSGFSSHSSFATLFKSITGISPVTFINLLKKEKEEQLNHEI